MSWASRQGNCTHIRTNSDGKKIQTKRPKLGDLVDCCRISSESEKSQERLVDIPMLVIKHRNV